MRAKYNSISRSYKNKKCQAFTPILVLILILPAFIITTAPLIQDPISDISDLISDNELFEDSTIDEEAVIEKAQSLMKSHFTENQGQVDNSEVLFYGQIPNGMIGFGVSKILVWLENTTSCIEKEVN